MQHHLTLTCPECRTPEKAVGDPNEVGQGLNGRYHCFACGANGSYVAVLTPDPAPTEPPADS